MKKLSALLITAALALSLSACSDSSGETQQSSSAEGNESSSVSSKTSSDESTHSDVQESRPENAVSYKVSGAETPSAKSSSLDSPLSLNEWGTCSKLSLKDLTYTNVPVRIVSVKRGAEIYDELKESVPTGRYIFEPRDNEEYAVCEYEICLNGFPVPEGGTLCDISGKITGNDGMSVTLSDGIIWGTTVTCLDEDTYYYDGVIHSQFCFPIPKEVHDYLIVLGEYGESEAYFKAE